MKNIEYGEPEVCSSNVSLSASNHDEREAFAFPVSSTQARFWELDRLRPGNPACNVAVRFQLDGPLDVSIMELAFNEIIRRHEVLRANFSVMNGSLSQLIVPSLVIKLPVVDLRDVTLIRREAELDRLSTEEACKSFDLSAGPLLRASLIRSADERHILLVTAHHLVLDGWSVGLITNELGIVYEAFQRGSEPNLPPLPIQYTDFAVWQNESLESGAFDSQLDYWRRQLRDLQPPVMPFHHPKPAALVFGGLIVSRLLPRSITDQLKQYGTEREGTFFVIVLSVFKLFLHLCTDQTDICLGTQVSGRDRVELENLIGPFINTVLLRTDLSGNPTFDELVERVRSTVFQSVANQEVPFERVLEAVGPSLRQSVNPTFAINFICQRDFVKPLSFAGVSLTAVPSKSQGALYDLNVFLVERADGWRLSCEYNVDMFDAATIEKMLADYKDLLHQAMEKPDARVSEFRLPKMGQESLDQQPGDQQPGDQQPGDQQPGDHRRGDQESDDQPSGDCEAMEAHEAMEAYEAHEAHALPSPPRSELADDSEAVSEESYAMPASLCQRRFWMLDRLAPGNPAFNMPIGLRIKGAFDHAILQRSLDDLVQRHEALRTSFEWKDGELFQVIALAGKLSVYHTSLENPPLSEAERKLHAWELFEQNARRPLQLSCAPLLRVNLVRFAPDDHLLTLVAPHIICDGWSNGILVRELWLLYESHRSGLSAQLPVLRLQYGDFAHAEIEWLQSEMAEESLAYWTQQLKGELPVLNLPIDRPVIPGQIARGEIKTALLPEDLVSSLKGICKQEQTTMFALFLAAFKILLHRYTAQEDIVVGSPVASRAPDTEGVVGPFANPVCLRTNLEGDLTLRECLRRVREVSFRALDNKDVPFEKILEKITAPSRNGRNALFQFYFFYQTAFLQPVELKNLRITPMPTLSPGAAFELQLGVIERVEGLRVQLQYNAGLFDEATIERILGHLQRVVEQIVISSDQRVSSLELFSEAESRQIIQWREMDPLSRLEGTSSRMPRTGIERQLARIWEDILGIRSIGAEASFFDLGGHSLQVARLLLRVEESFGNKLTLASFFEAPTIGQMAALLLHDSSAKESAIGTKAVESGVHSKLFITKFARKLLSRMS